MKRVFGYATLFAFGIIAGGFALPKASHGSGGGGGATPSPPASPTPATQAPGNYTDTQLPPPNTGVDQLAAENVPGDTTYPGPPSADLPAQSWNTTFAMGKTSNLSDQADYSLPEDNSVWSGQGATGTITAGTAAEYDYFTDVRLAKLTYGGECWYQFTFHVTAYRTDGSLGATVLVLGGINNFTF